MSEETTSNKRLKFSDDTDQYLYYDSSDDQITLYEYASPNVQRVKRTCPLQYHLCNVLESLYADMNKNRIEFYDVLLRYMKRGMLYMLQFPCLNIFSDETLLEAVDIKKNFRHYWFSFRFLLVMFNYPISDSRFEHEETTTNYTTQTLLGTLSWWCANANEIKQDQIDKITVLFPRLFKTREMHDSSDVFARECAKQLLLILEKNACIEAFQVLLKFGDWTDIDFKLYNCKNWCVFLLCMDGHDDERGANLIESVFDSIPESTRQEWSRCEKFNTSLFRFSLNSVPAVFLDFKSNPNMALLSTMVQEFFPDSAKPIVMMNISYLDKIKFYLFQWLENTKLLSEKPTVTCDLSVIPPDALTMPFGETLQTYFHRLYHLDSEVWVEWMNKNSDFANYMIYSCLKSEPLMYIDHYFLVPEFSQVKLWYNVQYFILKYCESYFVKPNPNLTEYFTFLQVPRDPKLCFEYSFKRIIHDLTLPKTLSNKKLLKVKFINEDREGEGVIVDWLLQLWKYILSSECHLFYVEPSSQIYHFTNLDLSGNEELLVTKRREEIQFLRILLRWTFQYQVCLNVKISQIVLHFLLCDHPFNHPGSTYLLRWDLIQELDPEYLVNLNKVDEKMMDDIEFNKEELITERFHLFSFKYVPKIQA